MSNDPESTDEPDTLLGPILADLAGLREELRAAADARWRLARLELIAAARDLRKLTVAIVVAALLLLISLPVLIVAGADLLDGSLGINRTGWLLIEFATLVIAAVATAWLAWTRFRSRFVGLEETLEVLKEDLAWAERVFSKAERPGEPDDVIT